MLDEIAESRIAIWGTGSLCDHFLRVNSELSVEFFFDNNSSGGEKAGTPVYKPCATLAKSVDKVVICSSFVSEIAPDCMAFGIAKESIYVVLPRIFKLVSLQEFRQINGRLHYYGWQPERSRIDARLSSDIVYPGVYEEIAKSVSYCIYASVEGHFAEFGTCTGNTASLIAYSLAYYRQHMAEHEASHGIPSRELHLFDSFAGFPEATHEVDINSPHVASGAWGEGTAKGLSEQELRDVCAEFLPEQLINTYSGWFSDSLTQLPLGLKLAFIHIDCDLYQSTIDVLDNLFMQRVISEGAVVLFDNWLCNRARPDMAEQKAWQEMIQKYNVAATDLGIYGCVGNRFIIHSYN